jgi:hypothetical protein
MDLIPNVDHAAQVFASSDEVSDSRRNLVVVVVAGFIGYFFCGGAS